MMNTTMTILDNGAEYLHLDTRDLEADLKKAQRPWKHNKRKTLDPMFSDWEADNSVFDRTIAHLESQLNYMDPYGKVVHITLFEKGDGKPQGQEFTAKIMEWIGDKMNHGFRINIKYVDPYNWGFSS